MPASKHFRTLAVLAGISVLTICLGITRGACEDEVEKVPAPKLKVDLAVYDVRDFTSCTTDFPAPTFGKEAGPCFVAVEAPVSLAPSDVAALIKDRLLPAEFADPSTSIEESGGKLVVMQTAAVHTMIEKLLAGLRAQMNRRLSVQALEIAIEPEQVLAWLGKAGKPVAKSTIEDLLKEGSGATMLSAPQFVAFNKQRGHVLAGRLSNYVEDADVAGATLDPVVRANLDGVVLDARPVLDASGANVHLDLRYTREGSSGPSQRLGVGVAALAYDSRTIKQYRKPETKTPEKLEAGKKGEEEKPAEDAKGGEKKEGEVEAEISENTGPRPIGDNRVTIELPRRAARTIRTNLKLPLATWQLAGMLDPVPNAAEGSSESKIILVFIRCENVNELPNTQ